MHTRSNITHINLFNFRKKNLNLVLGTWNSAVERTAFVKHFLTCTEDTKETGQPRLDSPALVHKEPRPNLGTLPY